MNGQVDYIMPINHDRLLVGSTVGQVAIYSNITNSIERSLVNEGLSVYEVVFSHR